ncbi:MAG TPA: hypothetical protein VHE14_04345 [Solirubrobacteraceae bacterium]|nr:hypothetical protein [Solirubrobacteraceae bacterium]
MATPRRSTFDCDVGAVVGPDIGTVDVLARLALRLPRLGCELRLQHTPDELRELLAFLGLLDVLGVEPAGQAEEREHRLGVEEEGELDDLPG